MNKRGLWILDSQLFYVIVILLAGVAFMLIPLLVDSLVSVRYEYPPRVEGYLSAQRFERCFGYPIEWEAFTQARLDQCYPVPQKGKILAHKVHLEAGEQRTLATKNWDPAQSFRMIEWQVPVLKNGEIVHGKIRVEVQNE